MLENIDATGVATVVGAIGAVGAAALAVRRTLSKDRTEMGKDRAEDHLISRLQSERDAAQEERDEALAEARREREKRTEDAAAIAALKAEVDHLRRDSLRLNSDIRKLVRGLPIETQRVLATDFAGLPEEPPNDNPSRHP